MPKSEPPPPPQTTSLAVFSPVMTTAPRPTPWPRDAKDSRGGQSENRRLASPPQVKPPHPTTPEPHRTLGVNQLTSSNLAVERNGVDEDEKYVDEIFGQLWVIPKPEPPRVSSSSRNGSCLLWVRKDLLKKRNI
jgi:hypothetical protein